jgi:hypothetical protein
MQLLAGVKFHSSSRLPNFFSDCNHPSVERNHRALLRSLSQEQRNLPPAALFCILHLPSP